MNLDDERRLAIGELARSTGVSTHTLRYYEAEGLIPLVQRNAAGHRRYRPDHSKWIGLLDRLRTSGMSIARMRDYVELAVQGDATARERAVLLRRHAADIEARIEELSRSLDIVRAKVDLYEGRIEDPAVVWELVDEARRTFRGVPEGLRSGV